MVKFEELLGKEKIIIPVNPIDIFQNLDKEIGKETLRDSQKAVLEEWYEKYQSQKDMIVKLHTGQGKTLIGLLILQSSLNEGNGPALYICPNNYLVDQIVKQARSFGIKTIQFTDEIRHPPREFHNSEAILVANCKKLFNGKSQFGVRGSRGDPINLGAIVIDDAHTCLDLIREQFSVKIQKENEDGNNPLYERLWVLFGDSLKEQAPGTHNDISHGEDTLLAVPFWTWYDKRNEVLDILSEYRESSELLFVWDLLKDHISECTCIFTGEKIEITPRLLPVDRIMSYSDAKRRIFLSATLTEDAFLIKDMGISPESIIRPLSAGDVEYSGERLILLPSLVNTKINREDVINWIQTLAKKFGTFGVVALVPSNHRANQWKSGGAEVTSVKNLYDSIEDLKRNITKKDAKKVLVLVNQYDGVDLPDSTCRILTLDSLPSYNTLMDRYMQDMRPYSGIIRRKLAQRVEQGMGRAIRGSNDWSIVIITGVHITNFLSNQTKRGSLSNEAQLQIEIGEELAKTLKDEGGQLSVINKLINQCLSRDDGWKQFYKARMSKLKPSKPHKAHIDLAIAERTAETLYRQIQYRLAAETLQNTFESVDPNDKSWLMQLRATYLYPIDPGAAMDIQVRAHRENSSLFRPPTGITYTKLTSTGTRESRILRWIKEHESYNVALMELREIMSNLLWGLPSDAFEQGFSELGTILGLTSERPEKKYGKGPDNLWHIDGKKHWIIECKNQVHVARDSISKREANQLLSSIEWFKETHETEVGVPIIIHPAQQLSTDAIISEAFWVIGREELKKIRDNTLKFYTSLTLTPFNELSLEIIKRKLSENKLDTSDLMKEYIKRGKHVR
jgi:replicative superfamily II helicase